MDLIIISFIGLLASAFILICFLLKKQINASKQLEEKNKDLNNELKYEKEMSAKRLEQINKTRIEIDEKNKNNEFKLQQCKIFYQSLIDASNAELNAVCEAKGKIIKENCEAIERLDNEKSYAYRIQLTCRVCKLIYSEPIVLPCSNTICQSHFNQKQCSFCLQFHEISLNDLKSNESLNESIKMCLHLNESEKKFKDEIEKLLETNKSLTEDLKQKEAESEILCFDHFAKIMNDIDLQREELKKRRVELCFNRQSERN